MNNFLRIQKDIVSVEPDVLFFIGDLPVSNSLLMAFVVLVILGIFGYVVTRYFKVRPSAFQNAVEMMYEGMYELVEQIMGSKKRADAVFPLIAALFVYIAVANILPLIPGFASFEVGGVSLFRTPTSDFNTTFALAGAMMILIQFVSIKEWGFFGYAGRFIKVKEVFLAFRKGVKEGVMAIVEFFIGLLDIVAEFAKVISLSFRLFGNMLAGEILAVLLLGAFAYGLPALWLSLNLLFAVVQAVVFGALVAAYYMLSVKPERVEA